MPLENISEIEPLLVEILREGRIVSDQPDIELMRLRRIADVERLDAGVRRIMFPHIYHVSLTQKLWDLKQELIKSAMSGG
jgi:nicotinate phosphoribosyltransferase